MSKITPGLETGRNGFDSTLWTEEQQGMFASRTVDSPQTVCFYFEKLLCYSLICLIVLEGLFPQK